MNLPVELNGEGNDVESENESDVTFDANRLSELTSDWTGADQGLLNIYVSEAVNFFPVISTDVDILNTGSVVKEIGCGIGLLSLLVANKGFRVISFEPESAGFSLMKRFQSAVRSAWSGGDQSVEWLDRKYSPPLSSADQADFIFAVNVLEHVPQWRELVAEIIESEKPGAKLRLIFPNYIYPYEPHFQIPTLFNKRLTRLVMSKKLTNSTFGNTPITDPLLFWEDLSWPTGSQVAKYCREMGYECTFSHKAFSSYLVRFQEDESFRERKGKLFTMGASIILPILTLLTSQMPYKYLPVIDITVTRSS